MDFEGKQFDIELKQLKHNERYKLCTLSNDSIMYDILKSINMLDEGVEDEISIEIIFKKDNEFMFGDQIMIRVYINMSGKWYFRKYIFGTDLENKIEASDLSINITDPYFFFLSELYELCRHYIRQCSNYSKMIIMDYIDEHVYKDIKNIISDYIGDNYVDEVDCEPDSNSDSD